MSTKPILFNTEMVRAILAGHKTVTRRVCKITVNGNEAVDKKCCVSVDYPTRNYKGICAQFNDDSGYYSGAAYPPYYSGDVLYVRETWAQVNESVGMGFKKDKYIYRANCGDAEAEGWKWRPSIHMPKEAARIFLRVMGVQVERLQGITVNDLQSEGIVPAGYLSQYAVMTEADGWLDHFKALWDNAIKPSDCERYGWAANPWVWCIHFERCEKPKRWPT